MFKKLIELIGGGSDDEIQEVQGSYLYHLLEEVRPGVHAELEREPDHDPVWLVAAEVFRASGGDSLEESPYNGPVTDPDAALEVPAGSEGPPQAAGLNETSEPPPPPTAQQGEEAEETQEFDRPDDVEENREELESEDAEIADPDDETEELEQEVVDRADQSHPDDVVVEEPNPPPAPTGGTETETADYSGSKPTDKTTAERVEESSIDSPEMLRTARVFLGMLRDNARLPDGLRMSVEDIQRVRTLLLGYFLGKQDVAMRANELMGVVETKFSEGYYSQARMLLELFGVHRETRLENDRKLFFREMNLKAMGGRSPQQSVAVDEELPDRLQAINEAEGPGFAAFFEWYASQTGVDLMVCGQGRQARAMWREALSPANGEGAVERCLQVVPPEQWQLPSEFEETTPELIVEQLDVEAGLEVVSRYIELVYFILRAVGDTGLEAFLDRFFDWSEDVAGVDAVQYLPELHHEIADGNRLVKQIVGELTHDHYAEAVEQQLQHVDEDDVHEALEAVVEQFQDLHMGAIAPAYYDLSGCVADELFGIELPAPEFHFKLHRLT
jgi:hypothetical protein